MQKCKNNQKIPMGRGCADFEIQLLYYCGLNAFLTHFTSHTGTFEANLIQTTIFFQLHHSIVYDYFEKRNKTSYLLAFKHIKWL